MVKGNWKGISCLENKAILRPKIRSPTSPDWDMEMESESMFISLLQLTLRKPTTAQAHLRRQSGGPLTKRCLSSIYMRESIGELLEPA